MARMIKPGVKNAMKKVGIILLTLGVVGGLYWAGKNTDLGKSTDSGNKGEKSFFSKMFKGGNDKDYITVGTNTYAGFLPFMYLNNGLEPTEDCPLFKDYGLKLKIVVQDDFLAGRAAFQNDEIDIIYCTADALCTEMSEGSQMADARFFNISNWSRGADAIVVKKNIKTVNDLIGKVVACSFGTASHTLLLNTLETNGIGVDRVNLKEGRDPNKVNIKKVESGVDAAAVFKAGKCDAAVVYSPDDQDIVSTMNARVLVSTKQASNIICDGLIAKANFLDNNREDVEKLIAALLWANDKMNSDPKAVETAAQVFAKSYGTDTQFAIDASKNIHYCTLGDEANFMGLDATYTGVTGSALYSKMVMTYKELGLCKSPMPWNKVSDTSIIDALVSNPSKVEGNQKAEGMKKFSAPTKEIEHADAISSKKVTIEYPTNGYTLSNDATSLIDSEFVPIVKQFSGSRIRVVGNTDNTGSDAVNEKLSYARAKSVVDYLVKVCGCDPNQFVIVGNGSKKAKLDGVKGDNHNYRTTDLELIVE